MRTRLYTYPNCIFVSIACALLTSCTMAPNLRPPANQTMAWPTRATTLNRLTDWQLKGALAFKTSTAATSVTLNWQQKGKNFTLTATSPLGISTYTIQGTTHQTTLLSTTDQPQTARTPGQLILQQTGLAIPITHITYWIRGLPVPGIAARMTFDAYQHIQQLQQSGYRIDYLRYNSVSRIDLPTKMIVTGHHSVAKIIITQWQIDNA